MSKNPWEGGGSQQPAEASETQGEAEQKEQLKAVVRCAQDRIYEMANPKMFAIDAKPNNDPTVADVLQRTRTVIENEGHAQANWGPRAQAEAGKAESEKERYGVFHPGKGPTAQENLELSQNIQGSAEALLARLAEVSPDRKMKDVLREWQ